MVKLPHTEKLLFKATQHFEDLYSDCLEAQRLLRGGSPHASSYEVHLPSLFQRFVPVRGSDKSSLSKALEKARKNWKRRNGKNNEGNEPAAHAFIRFGFFKLAIMPKDAAAIISKETRRQFKASMFEATTEDTGPFLRIVWTKDDKVKGCFSN